MKEFEFIPTENMLNHPDWRASTYKGYIKVVARSEERARDILKITSMTAVTKELGEKTPINPWGKPSHVACTEITDPQASYDREQIIGNEDLAIEFECNDWI